LKISFFIKFFVGEKVFYRI